MRNLSSVIIAALIGVLSFCQPSQAAGLPGVDIKMNQVFRLDFFNMQVRKVEWMPAGSSFASATAGEDAGKGVLVLTIEVRNASQDASGLPDPVIQAMMKSGDQTSAEPRVAYNASGKEITGDYQFGDGPTVKYVIPDVEKPSATNPVTKIVFTPSYVGDTGPAIFRLYQPIVKISE